MQLPSGMPRSAIIILQSCNLISSCFDKTDSSLITMSFEKSVPMMLILSASNLHFTPSDLGVVYRINLLNNTLSLSLVRKERADWLVDSHKSDLFLSFLCQAHLVSRKADLVYSLL